MAGTRYGLTARLRAPDHPILLGLEQVEAAERRTHDDRGLGAGQTGPRAGRARRRSTRREPRPSTDEGTAPQASRSPDLPSPSPVRSRRPSRPGPGGTCRRPAPRDAEFPDRPSTRPCQVESMSRPRQVTAACPTTKIRSGIPVSQSGYVDTRCPIGAATARSRQNSQLHNIRQNPYSHLSRFPSSRLTATGLLD